MKFSSERVKQFEYYFIRFAFCYIAILVMVSIPAFVHFFSVGTVVSTDGSYTHFFDDHALYYNFLLGMSVIPNLLIILVFAVFFMAKLITGVMRLVKGDKSALKHFKSAGFSALLTVVFIFIYLFFNVLFWD